MNTVSRVVLPCAAILVSACGISPRSGARPEAEFLLVADDSTAWVHTFADTVIVHRAALRITTLDRRLIEIYMAEEPINFEDASFLVTRVFRRDLVRGDSTLLFADSTVLSEAMAFARAHPDAERLDENDGESLSERSLESSVTLLASVGPTLSIEVHRDRNQGDAGTHDTFRATIDLRTGRRLTLGQVVDSSAARAAFGAARVAFSDAVTLAWQRRGPVGKAASRALALLTLDSLSFSLTRSGDALAVQYVAHDEQVIDEMRDAHRFSLEPLTLRASPDWWAVARRTLPRDTANATTRFDPGPVALEIRYGAEDQATIVALTASGSRAVAQMRGPIREVIAVSDTLLEPRGQWRSALKRAFAESGYYSEQVRAVSLRSRARPTAARQAAL